MLNINLPNGFINALQEIFSKAQLFTDPSDCWVYGYDNSRKHHLPDVVVLPEFESQVQATIALCYEHNVPITPRGRASGTTGGAIPIQGGLVLSLERMNKILDFQPKNRLIIVEAGVLNQTIQETVKINKINPFFWGPDPSSMAYCTVGGNLACNAAGPRSVKYGTTRDNTLGLTAFTGDAQKITTGVHTTKGVVGYDLTRLLIGSEGTLGIITQATLKLLPLPQAKHTVCAFYNTIEAAIDAIVNIMSSSIIPCALEFIDGASIEIIRQYSQYQTNKANKPDLPPDAKAMLLVEVDGSQAAIDLDVKSLMQSADNAGLIQCKRAKTPEEIQTIWTLRKALSPALRTLSPHKINEDIVIPIANMPAFFAEVEKISQTYQIPIVNFGHGGNGNIHVNLLADPLDPQKGPIAHEALKLVFDLVLKLEGTLSGEHGVGIEKRAFVPNEISPSTLNLMRKIKSQFDPKGILNPGKIF